MKIEPVRYSRLIMQLMTPTPMKALRQARSASPSSERRTGAAAINSVSLQRIRYVRVLPMFSDTVYLSHVNLYPVHPFEAGGEGSRTFGQLIRCRRQPRGGFA